MIDMFAVCRTKAAIVAGKRKDAISIDDIKSLAQAVVGICDELRKRQVGINASIETLNDVTERLEEIDGELSGLDRTVKRLARPS